MKKNPLNMGILLLLLSAGFAGCRNSGHIAAPAASQAPIPVAWPISTQMKMQAAHHWRLLAEDFSSRIQEELNYLVFESRQPVHIVPSGTTPFEKAFRELLITCFVEKQIPVTEVPEGALPFSVRIQLIRHGRRMIRTPRGVYESLAPIHGRDDISYEKIPASRKRVRASRLNVEAGRFTRVLPKNEIMITASLMRNKEYLIRESAIYYIDDEEWRHYRKSFPVNEDLVETVTYYLVDHVSMDRAEDLSIPGKIYFPEDDGLSRSEDAVSPFPVQEKNEGGGPLSRGILLLQSSNPTGAKIIQNRLAELGFFRERIDGIWQGASIDALREFKRKNGLPDTGDWDLQTQKRLFSDTGK